MDCPYTKIAYNMLIDQSKVVKKIITTGLLQAENVHAILGSIVEQSKIRCAKICCNSNLLETINKISSAYDKCIVQYMQSCACNMIKALWYSGHYQN